MKPVHILLVEDNPADAELTCEAFETSKLLLKIDVVGDGVEALDYLLRQGAYADAEVPDIVLLDLNVPKIDGRQVLATMRATDSLRHIPVVVLTSSDAERDIVESYRTGANCYVTKPVDLQAFQAIVRSVEGFWFTVVKLP
jgi:two-component system, chemotaxis family, response regulator Rcp1